MPSNLYLSAPVITPATVVVAAGNIALVPSELLTVNVVAAAVVVRFVLTFGAAFVRVTVPDVPPPLKPVPAITPVISPGLDVALIVTILVAASAEKLTLVPALNVAVSSLFVASNITPSKSRCLNMSCEEPLSLLVIVTVPYVPPPLIPAPAVTPVMSPTLVVYPAPLVN